MKLYYNPKLKERARKLRKNMSLPEVMLWNQLKRKKLGCDFHRQKPVDNYIVDFFCSEHNLVIEIDGKVHMDKGEYDLKRQCKLEALGLKVLRFKASDVLKNIQDVVEAIKFYIECEVSKTHPVSRHVGNHPSW